MIRRKARVLAYLWAFPTTAIGLVLGTPALISGGSMQWVDGVLEIYGGFVDHLLAKWTLLEGGASAMTLGHVVLGRDKTSLEWSRTHERVHVHSVNDGDRCSCPRTGSRRWS